MQIENFEKFAGDGGELRLLVIERLIMGAEVFGQFLHFFQADAELLEFEDELQPTPLPVTGCNPGPD